MESLLPSEIARLVLGKRNLIKLLLLIVDYQTLRSDVTSFVGTSTFCLHVFIRSMQR